MSIDAVIFDLDGTLIDTEKHYMDFWIQSMSEHGFSLTRRQFIASCGLGDKESEAHMSDIAGTAFDYGSVVDCVSSKMEHHIKSGRLAKKPGVDETILFLKKNSYKIAVATSTEINRAKMLLETVNILDKFDCVVSACEVKRGKPSPDVYLYACERLGLSPSNCVAVEDAPNGVISAYNAGLRVAMAPDLSEPDEAVKKMLWKELRRIDELIFLLGGKV